MKQYSLSGLLLGLLMTVASCKRDIVPEQPDFPKSTNNYPTDVLTKWIDLQTRIISKADQTQRPGYDRVLTLRLYAYSGIALYEAVMPGMMDYQSLSGQLTDMPQMPKTEGGTKYHWAASANAALAAVQRGLLYSATAATKTAIDSLETALRTQYETEADAATVQRSIEFGKEIAKRIVDWSEADGSFTTWPLYTPPAGPGLWVPTPPNNFAARFVHVGDQRTFVPNIVHTIFPPAPPSYSTDPASAFYKMEKEVYEAVQNRTAEDSLQATYWGSNVQLGSPSLQWFVILKKVLAEQSAKLDKAALASCKIGMAQYDAVVVAYKSQYTYNLLRPVTYIRNVLGDATWLPFRTPGAPTPDWPEAPIPEHAAAAGAMSSLFGDDYRFTTEGVNPGRPQGYSFTSFDEAAEHAGISRFLSGVTTKPAVTVGLNIGFNTVKAIDNKIKFKKSG